MAAFEGIAGRGRQVDGLRAHHETVIALLERNWPAARAAFLVAKRDLSAAHAEFSLALLNLAVGTRGHGDMPEAADALAAAREFFTRVGAESFVERYQTAMVPWGKTGSRAASTEAVPNPAR